MRILLVEDDALFADAMQRGLTRSGFSVNHVASAERAEAAIQSEYFDLLLVDLGLPGINGIELVRRVRNDNNPIPVLIATARDDLADRINALDIGGDDYLVKPFAMPELAARCRALIRRSKAVSSPRLTIGALHLDLTRHEVRVGERRVELPPREWAILECLALHVGQVVRKERLHQLMSGWDSDVTANAVEVYVSRLRSRLGDAVALHTLRGLGYRLDEA